MPKSKSKRKRSNKRKRTSKTSKKNKNKSISRIFASFKKKGTAGMFKRWCKDHKMTNSRGQITKQCIDAGIKSKTQKIRRRAQFANNFRVYSTRK